MTRSETCSPPWRGEELSVAARGPFWEDEVVGSEAKPRAPTRTEPKGPSMRHREFRPCEPVPLEGRVVPSRVEALPLVLDGFEIGTDRSRGTAHRLASDARAIEPLGLGHLTGSLVIPTAGGPHRTAHGSARISDARGEIVVSLRGTVYVITGTGLTSGLLTYRIVSGTGAYRGATGSGPVLYGPGPALRPGHFLLNFGDSVPPP